MAPGRVTDPLAVLCVFESNLLQFPRAVLDFGCLNKVIFTSPRMSYLPRRIPTCRRWVNRTTQPHVPHTSTFGGPSRSLKLQHRYLMSFVRVLFGLYLSFSHLAKWSRLADQL